MVERVGFDPAQPRDLDRAVQHPFRRAVGGRVQMLLPKFVVQRGVADCLNRDRIGQPSRLQPRRRRIGDLAGHRVLDEQTVLIDTDRCRASRDETADRLAECDQLAHGLAQDFFERHRHPGAEPGRGGGGAAGAGSPLGGRRRLRRHQLGLRAAALDRRLHGLLGLIFDRADRGSRQAAGHRQGVPLVEFGRLSRRIVGRLAQEFKGRRCRRRAVEAAGRGRLGGLGHGDVGGMGRRIRIERAAARSRYAARQQIGSAVLAIDAAGLAVDLVVELRIADGVMLDRVRQPGGGEARGRYLGHIPGERVLEIEATRIDADRRRPRRDEVAFGLAERDELPFQGLETVGLGL